MAVAVAVLAALGVVALVVFRSAAPAMAGWDLVEGPGFTVNLPAPASPGVVPGGRAHEETAVAGDRAYTVAWYGVNPGADPLAVLSSALHALVGLPATVLHSHPAQTGPFASVDVTARLPRDYLHGRILVVAARAYLVGEITPEATPPADLTRLLAGFNPDPSAT